MTEFPEKKEKKPAREGGFFSFFGAWRRRKPRTGGGVEKVAEAWQQTLDGIPDLVFLTDKNRTLTRVNRAVCDFFQKSSAELIGKKYNEIAHPAGFVWPDRFFRQMLRDGKTRAEETPGPNGAAFRITVSPILGGRGEILGAVHVATDITGQRKIEKELKETRDHLDEMVVERTVKLEETNQKLFETAIQLAKVGKSKSEFLTNMSHELRTPLNSILGFSEVLYDQTFGPMNEKQKMYIENVLTSGRHLLSLINEVLDLAKVEAGKMTLEFGEVLLRDVVDDAVTLVKESAYKKNLEVKVEIPDAAGTVRADGLKLRQVLCNLLFNAVKFTPSGGSLGVRAQIDDSKIHIAVWDTGVGIDQENLERIFEAFSRVESPYTKETEGTGLGLALCKKMVELHGGRIWAESPGLGLGTTVKFFLPAQSKKENG